MSLIDLLTSEKRRIQVNLNTYQVSTCDIMFEHFLKSRMLLRIFAPLVLFEINIRDKCVEKRRRLQSVLWLGCYPLHKGLAVDCLFKCQQMSIIVNKFSIKLSKVFSH
jgi:hypothetical protein